MGTTYYHECYEKADIVNKIKAEALQTATYGKEVWAVQKHYETGENMIVLYLLYKCDGIWGFKDIPECMGPYYFKCPLKFLEMAPEVNANWRDGVREYHKEQKRRKGLLKKLKLGAKIKLNGRCLPNVFVVTHMKPLLGANNGLTYKIPKTRIEEVEEA